MRNFKKLAAVVALAFTGAVNADTQQVDVGVTFVSPLSTVVDQTIQFGEILKEVANCTMSAVDASIGVCTALNTAQTRGELSVTGAAGQSIEITVDGFTSDDANVAVVAGVVVDQADTATPITTDTIDAGGTNTYYMTVGLNVSNVAVGDSPNLSADFNVTYN